MVDDGATRDSDSAGSTDQAAKGWSPLYAGGALLLILALLYNMRRPINKNYTFLKT